MTNMPIKCGVPGKTGDDPNYGFGDTTDLNRKQPPPGKG